MKTKVKKLVWDGNMTMNTGKILYRIMKTGVDEFAVYFYHGWSDGSEKPIYRGSVDGCEQFAQSHFEDYIYSEFFE